MEKIKLGVIGCGMAFERLHFDALMRLKDKYEIVCICDIDKENLVKTGKRLGIDDSRLYYNYNNMLENENINAVLISVPIDITDIVAEEVIKRKLNVLIEKPFSTNEGRIIELINLQKENNVEILILENYVFNDETKFLKKVIDSNILGEIIYALDINMSDFKKDMTKDTFAKKEWRQHPNFDGGIFMDSSVHNIARLRYIFGDIQKICVIGKPLNEDYCKYEIINTQMSTSKKAIINYMYCCTKEESILPKIGFRIFGSIGELHLVKGDNIKINILLNDGRKKNFTFKKDTGYYNEFLHFYNVINKIEDNIYPPINEINDIIFVKEVLKKLDKSYYLLNDKTNIDT